MEMRDDFFENETIAYLCSQNKMNSIVLYLKMIDLSSVNGFLLQTTTEQLSKKMKIPVDFIERELKVLKEHRLVKVNYIGDNHYLWQMVFIPQIRKS